MSTATPAVFAVQTFLDAYNRRDIDGFVGQLDENVLFEDDANLTLTGAAEVRAAYDILFKRDADQRSILLGRMVSGPYVIDMEHIEGRPNSPFTIIVVYEVANNKITHVRILRM